MDKESYKANKISCWVITEGMAGTENQCLGVTQAMGITPEVKRISLNEPWRTLSPYLKFEKSFSFSPKLHPPWPDILIASGRKSIAASRFIKRMSSGKTFTVQLQDPRISIRDFDLIAVPEHDPLAQNADFHENVIVTKATPNKITVESIEDSKNRFPDLEQLPSPRVAVLIGGNSKAYTLTRDITEQLAQQLSALDASLMITCSRRTGEDSQAILKEKLDSKDNYFWDGQGKNPYLALLGWADYILVTADSASMISESCTTGKPVFMIDLEGGSTRISKLHENLIKGGILKLFEGKLEDYKYKPLNDAQVVAKAIEKRFGDFTQGNE